MESHILAHLLSLTLLCCNWLCPALEELDLSCVGRTGSVLRWKNWLCPALEELALSCVGRTGSVLRWKNWLCPALEELALSCCVEKTPWSRPEVPGVNAPRGPDHDQASLEDLCM
ncbi:hypothetical protein OTU49_012767 [Cherax quadricarinatus]|uniref:Secreted protein n=1 Tax=Cherax quadricarinatus TaxID=27406 RepID=A0AAW0Y2N2_CHEQU